MRKSPVYSTDQVFIEDFDRRKDIELKFKISSVSFFKKGFAIVSTQVIENDQHILFPQNEVVVKGDFNNPRKGDIYQAIGRLELSDKYGYSISIKKQTIIYPKVEQDIVKYLMDNVNGLGKIKTTKIVNFLGVNTLRTIELNPAILDSIPDLGLTTQVKKNIIDQLSMGESISKVIDVLTSLKIDPEVAFELFDKYGFNTYKQLLDNPYILADVRPLLWPISDRIFHQQLQNNKSRPRMRDYTGIAMRYRSAIKFYLKLELEMTGSLAVSQTDLLKAFKSGELLNTYGSFMDQPNNHPGAVEIKKRLEEMIGEGIIVRATSKNDEAYIYMAESYYSEQQIVKLIKNFNKTSKQLASSELTNEFIDLYETETGFKLAKKQRLAVNLLVNNKISILTGGPGTGKTQTLRAVKDFVSFLKERDVIASKSIAFLAPTGKAARRMSEVLKVSAQTIHRKLKLGGFGKEEKPKQVREKFIVVDETSMIDVHLFAQLLGAMSPSAHILLVGDEHQLPSVGAGLILRDLIESAKVKTVLLDQVFRQSEESLLIDNSIKMKNGIGMGKDGLEFRTSTQDHLKDSYFIETKTSVTTKSALLKSIDILITKYGQSLDDIMVLTAQKKGKLGTSALNSELQKLYNKNLDGPKITRKKDNVSFYVGDRVMQLVNNYNLDVFNGEMGEVIDVKKDEVTQELVLVVNYPGHDLSIEYSGGLINDITLAYAITVHKSQGSESKIVIQLVDSEQERMLSRSLIYTGYTRTKSTNFLIGQKTVLNKGLLNTDNLKRSSLIKEKL